MGKMVRILWDAFAYGSVATVLALVVLAVYFGVTSGFDRQRLALAVSAVRGVPLAPVEAKPAAAPGDHEDVAYEDVLRQRALMTLDRDLRQQSIDKGVSELRCGEKLFVRDDDKPEVIAKRLDTYHTQTEPLVDYYDERSLLRRVDARCPRTRSAATSARSWPRCGWKRKPEGRRHVPGRHHRQDARADRPDGGCRATFGSLPEDAEVEVSPRGHDDGPRRRRGAIHRLAGRRAVVSGLSRLSRFDLRFAELHGRPRHPRPA